MLLLGAVLSHLLRRGPGQALDGIGRPLAYLLGPLREAYETSHDVALLGYLALQAILLLLLWGRFGGALYRLAAVDLVTKRREESGAAQRFAARHWRAFVGSRLALWVGFGLPLALGVVLALLGRLPGAGGGVLLALAVVGVVLLVLLAVLVGATWLLAGFLPGPVIAGEDADAFDAVSRTFGYAAAGLPRLLAVRLLFFAGVLLGTAWRLLCLVAAALLAIGVLQLGAGADLMRRVRAVLGALGEPPDAARLGLVWSDYLVAAVLALALFALLVAWLADLVTRVVCARTAAWLLLRQEIDRLPPDRLSTPPQGPTFQSAAEAGFAEVQRLDEA